jgi:hypothetical protein
MPSAESGLRKFADSSQAKARTADGVFFRAMNSNHPLTTGTNNVCMMTHLKIWCRTFGERARSQPHTQIPPVFDVGMKMM